MLYKKEGLPEESELVLCTVTKVQHHSVFVNIEEYRKSGMIHISEVSPGRIRNIRDFVKEDKVIVCKVLRVDQEKGHIDLSLRRVTESQRRNKVNQVKQEQKSEKILEFVARNMKKDLNEIYDSVAGKIFKEYEYLYMCFEEIVAGNVTLEKLGIEKNLSEKITELVKQRIKPPEVHIVGAFSISSFEPDGVQLVINALEEAEKDENVELFYLGAGKYKLDVKASNYKDAEAIVEKATVAVKDSLGEKGIVSFERVDKSKAK